MAMSTALTAAERLFNDSTHTAESHITILPIPMSQRDSLSTRSEEGAFRLFWGNWTHLQNQNGSWGGYGYNDSSVGDSLGLNNMRFVLDGPKPRIMFEYLVYSDHQHKKVWNATSSNGLDALPPDEEPNLNQTVSLNIKCL